MDIRDARSQTFGCPNLLIKQAFSDTLDFDLLMLYKVELHAVPRLKGLIIS